MTNSPYGAATGAGCSNLPTAPDFEARIDAACRKLIEPAALIYGVQKHYGDKVRQETKEAYGRLVNAHLLIAGVLGAALLRINGKIVPITSDSSGERDALFGAFIIGMGLCEDAIEQGRYLQAQALLRQEMETIAQLKAVRAGKRNEQRSPNVGCLEKSMARLYDQLSAAAHLSKHWIVKAATEWEMSGDHLPGPTSGTRYFPAFDRDVARRCFALHLQLTISLIEELSLDLDERHEDDAFTDEDSKAITLAMQLMEMEGMVTLVDRSDGDHG